MSSLQEDNEPMRSRDMPFIAVPRVEAGDVPGTAGDMLTAMITSDIGGVNTVKFSPSMFATWMMLTGGAHANLKPAMISPGMYLASQINGLLVHAGPEFHPIAYEMYKLLTTPEDRSLVDLSLFIPTCAFDFATARNELCTEDWISRVVPAIDASGSTALMNMITESAQEDALSLLELGPETYNAGVQNEDGDTALMLAIEEEMVEVAMALIGLGPRTCNTAAQNHRGDTALTLAIDRGLVEVMIALILQCRRSEPRW